MSRITAGVIRPPMLRCTRASPSLTPRICAGSTRQSMQVTMYRLRLRDERERGACPGARRDRGERPVAVQQRSDIRHELSPPSVRDALGPWSSAGRDAGQYVRTAVCGQDACALRAAGRRGPGRRPGRRWAWSPASRARCRRRFAALPRPQRAAMTSTGRSLTSSSRRASRTRAAVSQRSGRHAGLGDEAAGEGARRPARVPGQVRDGQRLGQVLQRPLRRWPPGPPRAAGTGRSSHWACPPSRCGATTIRRATLTAASLP